MYMDVVRFKDQSKNYIEAIPSKKWGHTFEILLRLFYTVNSLIY